MSLLDAGLIASLLPSMVAARRPSAAVGSSPTPRSPPRWRCLTTASTARPSRLRAQTFPPKPCWAAAPLYSSSTAMARTGSASASKYWDPGEPYLDANQDLADVWLDQ